MADSRSTSPPEPPSAGAPGQPRIGSALFTPSALLPHSPVFVLPSPGRPMVPGQLFPQQTQPVPEEAIEDEEQEEEQEVVEAVAKKHAPAWKTLLSGGIAGALSRTATAPLERLKILFQLSTMSTQNAQYSGMMDAVRRIAREDGVTALWKGNGTNVLRIAPYSAIGFFSFDRFFRIMSQDADPNLIALRRVIAGGMAGACAASCTYPLDLVRTRLTLQTGNVHKYDGIWHALRSVVKAEGPLGLYKGLATTLVGIIPYNAINFATFDTIQGLVRQYVLTDPQIKLSPFQSLWMGAASGTVAATATYPLDLLRRRMQMRGELGGDKVYNGFYDACRKIFVKEGIRGFFRGLIPCYLKVIPSNAIGFAVYDYCKKVFKFEAGSAPSGG